MNVSTLSVFLSFHREELLIRASEHIALVAMALLAATALGVPLAVGLRRTRRLGGVFLGLASVVQTIPSIALLSIMLPLFGLGRNSAVAALFLYALLPVIRNTLVGLDGVSPDVVDAARGMGMSRAQLFWRVELPLALPTIFAGLRTAAVINVGVATLSALVGAGGLGVFIFRGISNNQPGVVLLGAVPAALLALVIDALLALAGCTMLRSPRRVVTIGAVLVLGCAFSVWRSAPHESLRFGFPTGFVQRSDGYESWRQHYDLPAVRYTEFDTSLLYGALLRSEVDVAIGGSIDGRIDLFAFRALDDDRKFFPTYDAGVLARPQVFQRIPALRPLLGKLDGAISTATMRQLVRRVEQDHAAPALVALEFLRGWTKATGLDWQEGRALTKRTDLAAADIVIGVRASTTHQVMGRILEQLIDGSTGWNAQLKAGLGSTAICFESLQRGDIDLYPEYSGMLAVTIFRVGDDPVNLERLRNSEHLNAWLRTELARQYQFEWMIPFGFSSSYALVVRQDDPRFAHLQTISELAEVLKK